MAQGLEPSTLGAPDPEEFTRTRGDVEHFRQGDQSAFDRIWQRYRPALELLIAARVIPKLEPDLRQRLEADDILQTAAITIRESCDTFEYLGPGSVLAWMTAIVMHVVSDMIRYWRADLRDPIRERTGRRESSRRVAGNPGQSRGRPGSRTPRRTPSWPSCAAAVGAALAQVSERHRPSSSGASSVPRAGTSRGRSGQPQWRGGPHGIQSEGPPQLARLLPKPD
jgi:DNA-directed RNA polymerase specialized sigma24 family protein